MSKKNVRVTNGAARREARRWVLATQDRCAICGGYVDKSLKWPDPYSPSVDEIIPVCKGGSPIDKRNLQLAHLICNERRGSKSMDQVRHGQGLGYVRDPDAMDKARERDKTDAMMIDVDGKPLPRSREW